MKAYFAGGCFWCMEKPYHEIDGVISVESGYSGGDETDATYENVKSQKTLHRETVGIEYDENRLSYGELLRVYFDSIDPFDDGGQFIDRGRSYTCAVYYTDDGQRTAALEKIAEIERLYGNGRKAAVAVEPFRFFIPAEEYHRDYAHKNPEAYAKEYEESGRKDYFADRRKSEQTEK